MNVLITILKVFFVIVVSGLANSILYAAYSFLSFSLFPDINPIINLVFNLAIITSFFVLPFFLYRLFFKKK